MLELFFVRWKVLQVESHVQVDVNGEVLLARLDETGQTELTSRQLVDRNARLGWQILGYNGLINNRRVLRCQYTDNPLPAADDRANEACARVTTCKSLV